MKPTLVKKRKTEVEAEYGPTENEKALASVVVGTVMFFAGIIHAILRSLFRFISALA